MSARAMLKGGIAGLLAALLGLAGCEGGGGEPRPATGGAGIPGLKGPIGRPKGQSKDAAAKAPAAR